MGIELRGKNGAIDLSLKMIKGDDGGYYIPSIDSEGNLTWAPSETEMPAVEGANIKGQKGDTGTSGVWVGDTEPTGDYNVWIDPTGSETAGLVTQAELATKQDKLTTGDNITIDSNNVISASAPPTATTSTLGLVKPDGTSITIADGVISSTQPTKTSELTNDSGFITNEYHDATKQDKLTAGTNITIDSNNVISATGSGGGGSYTLPVASDNTLGGVKTGAASSKFHQVSIGGVPIRITQDGVGYIPFASNTSHGLFILSDSFKLGNDTGLVGLNPPRKFDSGFLLGGVCPDGTTITMTDKGIISSVVPTATTSTLGGVKPDGNTILVADDGTISSAASGLIGKSMADHDQPTSEWGWIADWAQHPEKYYVVIRDSSGKDCPVIYTAVYNSQFYYYWFEGNTLHQRYINFTDNTLSQVESVSQWADSGTVWLTQQNWQDYITTGGGSDWQVTTSTSDGNLYNAKEVVIFWQDSNYNRHQSYLNVGCDYWGNSGQTWGNSSWSNAEIKLDSVDNSYNGSSITYNGSNVNTSNCTIEAICYKT